MNDEMQIFLIFAFIIGASIGSFVTMASHRLPNSEDIVFKPSYCPSCKNKLSFWDLFPIISWIFQLGKCRYCKKSISFRYPLIEATLGLVFVAIIYFYGVSIESLFFVLLASELAILIVTDLECYIIPDGVQIALFITAIFYHIYLLTDVQSVIASSALGLFLGLLLHYGSFYILKKDALGFGDVKFLCVAGAWITINDFPAFLFFSGIIGIITGILWRINGRGKIFPFAPALAVSLFINVLMPNIIQRVL